MLVVIKSDTIGTKKLAKLAKAMMTNLIPKVKTSILSVRIFLNIESWIN